MPAGPHHVLCQKKYFHFFLMLINLLLMSICAFHDVNIFLLQDVAMIWNRTLIFLWIVEILCGRIFQQYVIIHAAKKNKIFFGDVVMMHLIFSKQKKSSEDVVCFIHIVVWIKMFKNIFVMNWFILILMKILNYGYKKESSKKGCKESSSEKRS